MDGSDRQQEPERVARASRVKRLREAVADGRYKVDPEAVAKALVRRLPPKN